MKKQLFSLSTIFLLNFSLGANTIGTTDFLQKDFKVTLEWLEQKPKSYAKDFFILQYLNQENLSFEDAKIAYEMANSKNSRVKKIFNNKYNKKAPIDLKCYRASIKELKQEDSRCMALGLSLKEATQISKQDLEYFIANLDPYPTLRNDLKVIASKDPFTALVNSNTSRFFRLFFDLGNNYRVSFFNKQLDPKFVLKLSKEKSFERFLRYVIFNQNLKNLQKSLFVLKDDKTLAPHIQFLLGINAINNSNSDVAYDFFFNTYNKSYLRSDKDKSLFWLYLITQNKSFLFELSKSWDNNLYALYAKELLSIKPDNIVYDISLKNEKSLYNIYDIFEWREVLSDTKKNLDDAKFQKYYNLFTDENTLPHLAFVLERYNRYKRQYFITPYKDILKDYDIYKQIMIYSIARQESRFIPSSISFASAQGVMQIMPFLSYDISKKLNDDYNIYEQFIPNKNIEYASFHLNTLMKQFNKNPLFIAYAYNGGAGYTRSQLKKGLFKEKNRFEPFLSMELISYSETREYGKKVLANYYIYNNYLNNQNKISLSTIFQSLVSPY